MPVSSTPTGNGPVAHAVVVAEQIVGLFPEGHRLPELLDHPRRARVCRDRC